MAILLYLDYLISYNKYSNWCMGWHNTNTATFFFFFFYMLLHHLNARGHQVQSTTRYNNNKGKITDINKIYIIASRFLVIIYTEALLFRIIYIIYNKTSKKTNKWEIKHRKLSYVNNI